MSDTYFWSDPFSSEQPPDPDAKPTWSDYGKTFVIGGTDVLAAVPAASRWISEKFGALDNAEATAYREKEIRGYGDETFESLTPAMQSRLTAALTSEEFWSHPFSSTAAKLTRMSPGVIAAVLPSSLISNASLAVAAASAAGGALSAGQTLDDIYRMTDEMSDEQLQKESPYYAGLRSMGMDEIEARADHNQKMIGMKPAVLFALGTATSFAGTAGQLTRAFKGAGSGYAGGRIARGVKEGLQGGTAEAIQSGAEAYASEDAAVEGGLQDEANWENVVNAMAEGGWLGGIPGVGAGLASRSRDAVGKKPTPKPGVEAPPTEATPGVVPGAPPAGPVGAESTADTTKTKPAKKPRATKTPQAPTSKVEVVDPIAPTAEQQAAIASSAPVATGTAAPEIATPQAPPAMEGAGASAPVAPVTPAGVVSGPVQEAPVQVAPVQVAPPVEQPAPVTPVAPVTTPPVTTEVTPVAEPEIKRGEIIEPGKPRILPDQTKADEAAKYDEQARKDAAARRKELKKTIKKEEAGGLIGKNWTKAELEKRQADSAIAQRLFNDNVPETDVLPTKKSDQQALKGRVEKILNEAAEAGVEIPTKTYDGTSDHMIWLREVQQLKKAFDSKTGAKLSHIQDFLMRERAAKGGDFAVMRSERKSAGEGAKRVDQGDVETKASAPDAEKDGVTTTVAKSSVKKSVKAFDEEVAEETGASVKTTENSPELAALKKRMNEELAAKQPAKPAPRKEVTSEGKSSILREDKSKKVFPGERYFHFTVGDTKGHVIVDPVEDGKHLHIRWVGDEVGEKGGFENLKLGASGLRQIKEALQEEFPSAKTIGGSRSTGAKVVGKENGDWVDTKIKLKPDTKPVVTEIKAEIDREAKKTNPNPTPAQAEAGNYEKGHPIVHGLKIAIETARGAIRRNKDPEGPKWEVKMPDHYGHILGTKGADGDPVDVYLGPDPESEFVFVIDQQHLTGEKAGQFDEHKVMLGYKDIASASKAYDEGFSDGRGIERIKDWRIMSIPELKAWLKTEETTQAAGVDPIVEHSTAQRAAPARRLSENYGLLRSVLNAEATSKGKLSDFRSFVTDALQMIRSLWGLNPGAGRIQDALAPAMFKRIAEIAGDTPVYVVSDETYRQINNDEMSLGFYHAGIHAIVVPESSVGSTSFTHTLVHEAAHAAFMKALWDNAPLRKAVDTIAREAHQAFNAEGRNSYAFTSLDEFLAEALSNPELQFALARTQASPELAAGVRQAKQSAITKKFVSLWDVLMDIVARTLRIPRQSVSLLDAIFTTSAYLEQAAVDEGVGPMSDAALRNRSREIIAADNMWHLNNPEFMETTNRVDDKVREFLGRPEMQPQQGKPWLLRLRTMDNIAREADNWFSNNPVRKIADLVEMIRTTGEALLRKSEPIIEELYKLEQKYKGTDTWREFTSLVHDETMAGVYADKPLDHADNAHLGKDTLHGAWPKAQWAELNARWKALPDDLKAARLKSMKYFTDQQNAMSLGIIKNRVLRALGVNDAALAQRIHEGHTTKQDIVTVGGKATMDMITQAKELAKIKGPYFPLMRRGDHVVIAYHKVATPAGATRVSTGDDPNTDFAFEFTGKDARERALAYAASQDLRPTVSSVWVDAKTGKPYFTDPKTGKEVKVTKQDTDAEQRFRVELQNRHVEFFDTAAKARAAAAELHKGGLEVRGVEERRYEPGDRQADMLSHQMQTLVNSLERRKGYRDMTPKMRNELIQALNEASIRFLGSTRVQSRRLPRTYVEGASTDLTRNTLEYAQSSSGYLARLQHLPALEGAMKEMRDQVGGDYSKPGSLGRSSIANIVEERVHSSNGFVERGRFAPAIQRVMTLSFIDKLASPAYSIINALQPGMVTMPVLAARYGMGRAISMMTQAYADVGAVGIVKRGVQDTVRRAYRPAEEPATYLEDVKSRLKSANERELLDYLAERGSIDPDAGLEIAKLIRARGVETIGERAVSAADAGVSYLEGIARQMPRAIETINRTVTALAAYRMELARNGGDHKAAMQYAQDAVNQTQFLYSNTNAPMIFNHPLAKLSFQFKKFGLGVYQILGSQVMRVVRNKKPGDRKEALKVLAYIAATHTVMAGTLGLPTEPIKGLVTVANMFGVTGFNWQDFENWERELASDMFGKSLGEMVTRGITRRLPGGFSFDLSSRVGLDNLMVFREPNSNETDDVWAWFADVAFGAPGSLIKDWHKGVNDLMAGEPIKAAESLIPIKNISDSIKAYRQATEGKKNKTGRQTMEPYSVPEAIVRGIGFTPGREAEDSAMRSQFYNSDKRGTTERQQLMADWANASPNERARMWGKVEKWNRGKILGERLTRAQLDGYVKRRKTEEQQGTFTDGLRLNKQNTRTYKKTTETYNYQ